MSDDEIWKDIEMATAIVDASEPLVSKSGTTLARDFIGAAYPDDAIDCVLLDFLETQIVIPAELHEQLRAYVSDRVRGHYPEFADRLSGHLEKVPAAAA